MYRYLIAFFIALTAAMLPAQTTPRNGATQSVNAGKSTLAPAEPRSNRSTPASTRDSKTQKTSERSSNSQTNTRTETTERSGSSSDVLTPKGSYRPGTSTPSTTSRSGNTTRPAYSNPLQARNAPRTSADRKKTAAKPVERVTINWMTLEEAMEKSKTEKRKIFVDVYTTWCGWCKHMDSTTFVSGAVAKYLNDHYYPVKFNAEQQNDIVFKDITYHFK
jgi:thiol-disulfide isomerase/thioredoxin